MTILDTEQFIQIQIRMQWWLHMVSYWLRFFVYSGKQTKQVDCVRQSLCNVKYSNEELLIFKNLLAVDRVRDGKSTTEGTAMMKVCWSIISMIHDLNHEIFYQAAFIWLSSLCDQRQTKQHKPLHSYELNPYLIHLCENTFN